MVIIHKSKPSTLLYRSEVKSIKTNHMHTYWSLQLGPEVITLSLEVSGIRHGLGKKKKKVAIKNKLHPKEKPYLLCVLSIHKLQYLPLSYREIAL